MFLLYFIGLVNPHYPESRYQEVPRTVKVWEVIANHCTFVSRKDSVETKAFRALCSPARATSSYALLGKSLYLSG